MLLKLYHFLKNIFCQKYNLQMYFNIAHYSKSIKDINIKHGMLAYYDKMQLQEKGHNSEGYMLGVMPLFTKKILSRMMTP